MIASRDKQKNYAGLKIFKMEFIKPNEKKEGAKSNKKGRKGHDVTYVSSFKKNQLDESPNKQSRTV